MKETQLHELTRDQLSDLADMVSGKLIKHLDEKEKRKKAYAYHNTKMLLKNYDKLKKHCDIVNEQLTEDLGTLWSDWRFDLDSLLEHKAKTAKLMKHVDKALQALQAVDVDSYKILKRKYLTPGELANDVDIAVELDVDRSTVTNRIKKACEALSILLFGVDVLLLKDK